MTLELKPMSLSELLDRTFTLYRNHFWLFCGLMALPEVVITICSLVSVILFPVRMVAPTAANAANPFGALSAMKSSLGATFVLLIVSAICGSYAFGAVTLAVSEIYMGRSASIRKSFRLVRNRLAGLLGLILMLVFIGFIFVFAGLMMGAFLGVLLSSGLMLVAPAALKVLASVLVALLVFACLIGGAILALWLLMRFAVSIPVFLLERVGVLDSLGRSGALTRGHRWRILGAVIIMYVVVYVVQLLFSGPFVVMTMIDAVKGLLPLWLRIGTSVAGAVASTLAGPLLMITLALIYYDVRIRKEAFDLEAMMAALGPSTPPAAGPAPSSE